MSPAERQRLQEFLNAFLEASAAPRKDGRHCDHCGVPPSFPHMTFCKYENTKQALVDFAFPEQKAEKPT